jgi:ATP-binding cassette subfamily C (CFTR/MRP) protein 1
LGASSNRPVDRLTSKRFRIIEPTHGHIEIDGDRISDIPPKTLRSRIAIIPQDTFLATGTIRANLDPLSIHNDTQIWSVLRQVHLESHVAAFPHKLSGKVEESGSNFSVGQRQLLSLARALLRNTAVLVLDEATASVDPETDRVLQDMLNGDVLKGRTVITIAHRLESVLGSDKVLVLENGRAAEFGTPRELMAKAGLFFDLLAEAGLHEQLM